MTLYHKYYDKKERLDKWQRHYIKNVFWTGGKGASFNKGYEQANDVTIRVWKSSNDLTDITFEVGDIVVKGNIEIDIKVESDLKRYSDVYNLTTVINNTCDDEEMDHYHLGGR